LHIDGADYQRLSGQTVTLHAVFGVVVYRTESSVKLRPDSVWTPVPGFGSVKLIPESQSATLWWRVPIREGPERFVGSIRSADSTVVLRAQHDGPYPERPDLFHISPVVFYSAPFERQDSYQPATIPPNYEAEITLEQPIKLLCRDLDVTNLRLADYTPGSHAIR
jgi:hypothetical protein